MRNLRVLFILVAILAFGCCVRARVSQYPGFDYSPQNPNNVQVFNIPPTVPFEVIGEVTGYGAPAASWGRVENYMREKAALIGGDAIIFVRKREEYSGTYTTPSSAKAFVYGNYGYYTYQ
ncbi:MAG: hypothetical protein R6V00_07405, partial [Candidatus Aminicenantes bacterium]